jgi:hypothetical protein
MQNFCTLKAWAGLSRQVFHRQPEWESDDLEGMVHTTMVSNIRRKGHHSGDGFRGPSIRLRMTMTGTSLRWPGSELFGPWCKVPSSPRRTSLNAESWGLGTCQPVPRMWLRHAPGLIYVTGCTRRFCQSLIPLALITSAHRFVSLRMKSRN